MKKRAFLVISFLAVSCTLFAQRYWVAAGTGNWNNTANWSTSSGGAGGASVPGPSDLAVFNGASGFNGNCNLNIAPTVAGITVNGYSGTIDLLGFNLTTTGTNTFTTGTITNTGAAAAVTLNTTANSTFNGTTFGASVNGTTGRVFLNGSTFNNTVNITKTSNNTDASTGGNLFQSTVTLTNSSTGTFRLAATNPDIFNGAINIISANTGAFDLAYAATGTQFNSNISITYNSTGAINFGSSSGTSTLAASRTISIAGFGGSGCGNLSIGGFTQTGATGQSITLAGNNTATLTLSAGTTFNGAVTFISPRFNLSGATFAGTSYLEKTGSTDDNCTGGTTYSGASTIVNSSDGQFNLANTNPDTFGSNVTLNNTGTSRIQIGIGSAGNLINGNLTINHGGNSATNVNTIIARNGGSSLTVNGNLILNNTNANSNSGIIIANDGDVTVNGNITVTSTNGRGVYFGNASGTVTQGAGFGITSGTFNSGTLSFSRFTQNGTTANSLTLTGSSTLIMTNASSFGGNVNFIAPRLYLSGCTFNGTATLEKNGAGDDVGTGGNTFVGTATITNSGSGYLMTGNGNSDQFNSTATFNNTGSYRIYFAHNHDAQTTTFASNLTINSNKSGGSDQWSYFIAENNASGITIGGNLVINNAGSIRSDMRLLNGTGSNITISGTTSINLTNANSATTITMGQNGTTTYNGNITVSNTGGAAGITFNNNASASSTVNGSISIGAGFSSGSLNLYRFNQAGAIAHSMTLTGDAALRLGPGSNFDGNVNFTSPQLYLNGCIYKGTAVLEKSGATNDAGTGGNDFRGVTTITNSGSGYLMTGNGSSDQFSAATTFNNTGSYRIYFAYNHNGQTTTFASDLTINANKSGGSDQYAYLIAESTGSNISIGGNLLINNAGTIRSDYRFLNGNTSTMAVSGTTTINLTNTDVGSAIIMGQNGATTYGGNITVSNTGGAAGITFNNTGSASSTLNGSISIGAGFSSGSLNLYRFDQVGAIAHNLTLTGSAALVVGPASEFDGNVNFLSPQIYLNGCVYQGTATIEKNGATNDGGTGGNTFNGVTTITNSGSGYLYTGNGSHDTFMSATTFNNTGSSRIYIANNHSGETTTFASTVVLNSNKTSGTDAWSYLIAEGTNTGISFAGNVTINCGGSIQSNHRILNGTGSTASYGGTVTINLTNTHPSTSISMGENGISTYSGNISVVNSGGASGITFNNGSGSSSTLTGSISSGTFSSGSLNLYRFVQLGAFAENITLTNGAIMRVGPSSSFDGNVNFVAPRLFLNGATYNGTTYLEKNGSGDDASNGGNTFVGTTTLVDSGSGYLLMANNNPDIFNGAVTITNSGSNWIFMAHNVPGNQFNNNITVNSTGSANGIIFSNNATGASTFTGGTMTVGGSGFTTGDLRLRRFTQIGAIAQSVTLTGTARFWIGPTSQFDGNVSFIAPQLLLNGATYNGTAYLEKNGATNDDGTGGNIFNQATEIVNSGSSYLLTSASSPDIFNANLILTNSGSSTIRMSDNAGDNKFNGNISLNSTFGGGIYFGNNASGTSTLAATKTIGVGSSGVISGDIRLIRFTQVGPTAQTLSISGIAALNLGPASSFGGNVDFRAPQLYLNGTTFSGTAYLEKNGATNDTGNGGNTFNGVTTLVNSGSGYLLTANTAADTFNGNLTVTNTGSSTIYLAHNVAGNQFNGNITFNSTFISGSQGIYFANNSNGAATLANGASLLVGGLGFSSGELRFRRFTQVGTAAQTLLLTGTALLRIGPSTIFNGNLDFRSPQFALDGAIYNGTTYLEKTGASNNDSSGGNVFNGTTTIANSGSGFFRFALSSLDTFNGDITLTNTGSSTIRMADNTPGTQFNGNITLNSTFGGGIYFSESGGGTATLANGKTISVGGLGFSDGELRLRRFTQTGTTAQNLSFTGTAGLILGPSITFNGSVDFRAPQLYINGGQFNGSALLEKNGATSNQGTGNTTFAGPTTIRLASSGSGYLRTSGGNTFNGATTLINAGSNDLLLELSSASTYNGDLTLTNTGSSYIRAAYIGNNSFNGNILVNSTSGTGIYFCENGSGTATLASGRTIAVGGTGFTAGELRLQRFTQSGATAQSLSLTGSSTFRSGPSTTWNGALTVSSPIVFLDGSTFNGATNSITKTGATTDSSIGGNTFSGTTSIINSGTGTFRLANSTGDDFTGNVIFNQSSGTIQPAYNQPSTFRGNVTVNGSSPITFGANNGTISFAGSSTQAVSKSGSASPVFRRLLMNKTGNAVTLNTDVSITTSATFTSGVLRTDAINVLSFADNAVSVGGSNSSHVDGPVLKIGNDAFSFPTGDNGIYRSIAISAPSNTGHAFTAEYFKTPQALGGPSTYASGLLTVSSCEYWILDRTTGTSNVNVTLSWNSPDCTGTYISDLPSLRVARWSGTNWVSHGNGGTTGNATTGTVTTSSAVTSFSPFALASTSLANPLPIELTSFTATPIENVVSLKWITQSELNNDFFTIERSKSGLEFKSLSQIAGAGTTSETNHYEFIDQDPLADVSYYRLKQTDFDGQVTFSDVVKIDRNSPSTLSLYPNPVSQSDIVRANYVGSFALFNSLGQLVLKVENTSEIKTSGLPSGVYTVKSSNGQYQRLVID